MGLARIGRLVFRAAVAQPEKYEIVGINDPFVDLDYMVYMTKYDRHPWPFRRRSKGRGRQLIVNGREVAVYGCMNPEIPWSECGAEYIVESTGVFTTTERLQLTSRAAPRRL